MGVGGGPHFIQVQGTDLSFCLVTEDLKGLKVSVCRSRSSPMRSGAAVYPSSRCFFPRLPPSPQDTDPSARKCL